MVWGEAREEAAMVMPFSPPFTAENAEVGESQETVITEELTAPGAFCAASQNHSCRLRRSHSMSQVKPVNGKVSCPRAERAENQKEAKEEQD